MNKYIKIIGGFQDNYRRIYEEEGFLQLDAINYYKRAEYDVRHEGYNVAILLPCGSWFYTKMPLLEFERLLNDARFNEKFVSTVTE